MERVLGRLHCGGCHAVGVKLSRRWEVTNKRVQCCLHCGVNQEAGA